MSRLPYLILSLFFLLPSGAVQATLLLDMESSMGLLHAQLNINGDTLQEDETGQTILMGTDQLLCTLTVHSQEKSMVTLPAFSGSAFGDFTLLDQGEIKTERTTEGLRHTRQWLIEPHNPGTYKLPELVVLLTKGSRVLDFNLPSQELTVQPLVAVEPTHKNLAATNKKDKKVPGKDLKKPGSENLDDILPPQVASPSKTGTIILFTSLFLVGLGLLLWLILYRRKKKSRPLPPQERALAEIAACADLGDREQIERLAFILRCYLTSRFELACLEQTYDEYGPAIENCPEIPQETRHTFLAILKRCDLIKFSNLEPEPGEAAGMAEQIKEGLATCPLALPDDKACGRW